MPCMTSEKSWRRQDLGVFPGKCSIVDIMIGADPLHTPSAVRGLAVGTGGRE